MLCSYEDQLNRQQMNNNNNNMMNTPAHQASMGWYSGYHQAPQMYSPPNAYYMHQEEQNVWPHHHHHHHHVPQHSPALFPNEYADFLGHNNYMQPASMHPLPVPAENQIPSPPCGSEISSSSTGGNITPPAPSSSRPAPVRSPYEWIKKPSYQNQPNPELDCPKAEPLLLDFTTAQETHGKTRTKDKYRVVYSDVQRVELEREFHFHNKYITIRRKSELAVLLGLSDRQIKIWFQNRRAKERKQLKKAAEENAREMNRANNNHEIPSFEGMLNQQMMQPSNALPVEQLLPVPSSHPIVHPTYAEGHNHLAERLMKLEVNDDHIG